MGKQKTEEKLEKIDILTQNYQAMDETGKEKLKEVTDQFLKIQKIITEKTDEK